MASDKRWVMTGVPAGPGRALDLGGGAGELFPMLHERGYDYTNLDIAPTGPGAVTGDAHAMPFDTDSFDIVLSSDSLEHFSSPSVALAEVRRVLRPGGRLVVWVPFMHPFHADDYYRYTPLGIDHLLDQAGLVKVSIEAPLGPFTIVANLVAVALMRVRLGRLTWPLRHAAAWLDVRLRRFAPGASYAPFYLVTATKPRS
jgi:SAM-dependent methyltransferase